MTQKFHINSKGEPKPCKATKRACRFGEHFESMADAQKFVESQAAEEHAGALKSVSKESEYRVGAEEDAFVVDGISHTKQELFTILQDSRTIIDNFIDIDTEDQFFESSLRLSSNLKDFGFKDLSEELINDYGTEFGSENFDWEAFGKFLEEVDYSMDKKFESRN